MTRTWTLTVADPTEDANCEALIGKAVECLTPYGYVVSVTSHSGDLVPSDSEE